MALYRGDFYCWSFGCDAGHNIDKCKNCSQGHQVEATLNNPVGGNLENNKRVAIGQPQCGGTRGQTHRPIHPLCTEESSVTNTIHFPTWWASTAARPIWRILGKIWQMAINHLQDYRRRCHSNRCRVHTPTVPQITTIQKICATTYHTSHRRTVPPSIIREFHVTCRGRREV